MSDYPDEGTFTGGWRDRWLASSEQCSATFLEQEVERLEAELEVYRELERQYAEWRYKAMNEVQRLQRLVREKTKCQT